MPYTYLLDDSIKLIPTLILTADHSTLLFLPGVFYKIKNFFFLLWVNLYMITDTYLHDPPPFNGPFFHDPSLFCSVKKLWPSLCFHLPPPLLISDKSPINLSFYRFGIRSCLATSHKQILKTPLSMTSSCILGFQATCMATDFTTDFYSTSSPGSSRFPIWRRQLGKHFTKNIQTEYIYYKKSDRFW